MGTEVEDSSLPKLLTEDEIKAILADESVSDNTLEPPKPADWLSSSVDNDDVDLTSAMKQLEFQNMQADFERKQDIHKWRNIYLGRSFYLVGYVIYISLSLLLFTAVGLFNIPNDVMITLLGTMVANTIGVLLIAFVWLYNKKENS